MSTPEINQVLAQMRVMSAQAQTGAAPPVEEAGAPAFGDLLKNSINAVNDLQQTSGQLKTAFELGEPGVDLAQVMIASQKASVSFQAMVQVRNKLVEAYKDVMNMPV
jgi:flagellar hook-basal body complex protein FliE